MTDSPVYGVLLPTREIAALERRDHLPRIADALALSPVATSRQPNAGPAILSD